ncbi:hypothetical protein PAEPH01_0452 [Pancytospora epiphaga]|nr:hypothetical protein PAEPH01_0452 [Pancytospora epiphaga]
MNGFEAIDKNRKEHGYVEMNFRQYKRFCNKMSREANKQGDENLLYYRLEANHVKFLLFKSPAYLHKCLRLLREHNSPFCNVYREYIMCHLLQHRNQLSTETLVELRRKLADHYTFLNDIYRIADDRIDFDQYKIKHQWNDITMYFETTKMLETFINGTLTLTDNRFNTQMAVRILEVEKALGTFKDKINLSEITLLNAYNISNELLHNVSQLLQFLDDNYLASEHVNTLLDETSSVHTFITQLIDYNSGNSKINPAGFDVPLMFRECSEGLKSLSERKGVDPSGLRNALINLLANKLMMPGDTNILPFPPVFYDIAFDYVKYPSLEDNIISPLNSMKLSENTNE